MLATLTCYACQDTWDRELTDSEVSAYLAAHPELEGRILTGEITEVDLGEVLCDGCEDFYREEAALDEAWQAYHEHFDDTDGNYVSWLCENCGDPAYDCGCDGDVEDEIDRKADLMAHGRL